MPRLSHIIVAVLGLFFAVANGTALTVSLDPQESSCYYVLTAKKDTAVGFYFAVQSGGSFDIDFTVKDPNGDVLLQGTKERQGDWTFMASVAGEYEFCFKNGMSTWAEKVVDFEIKLEDDFKAQLPNFDSSANSALQDGGEPVQGMISATGSIDEKLNNMLRTLQYYKTRNNRNQHTVKSTEDRIFWFSLLEIVLMCGMALFQISVVHFFFKGLRKQMV